MSAGGRTGPGSGRSSNYPDATALATLIDRLAGDRAPIDAMREACRASAARLTWARTVGELVEVYKAAVGRQENRAPLPRALTENRRS